MSLLEGLFQSGEQEAAAVRRESTQRTVEYLDKLAAEASGDPRVQEDLALMFVGQGLRKVEIQFFGPAAIRHAREWLASTESRKAAS